MISRWFDSSTGRHFLTLSGPHTLNSIIIHYRSPDFSEAIAIALEKISQPPSDLRTLARAVRAGWSINVSPELFDQIFAAPTRRFPTRHARIDEEVWLEVDYRGRWRKWDLLVSVPGSTHGEAFARQIRLSTADWEGIAIGDRPDPSEFIPPPER